MRSSNNFGALALIGLLAGAVYLPLTLQVLLGSGFLNQVSQSVTVFFFPVCWAVLGLGFLVRPAKYSFAWISSLWLFIFLLSSLAMPLRVDSNKLLLVRLLSCLIPACAWYFSLGRELNRRFVAGSNDVHLSYGVFMLGLAGGYALADQVVPVFGGNGTLVFLIAAAPLVSISPALAICAIPVLAGMIYFFGVDYKLERHRNVSEYSTSAAESGISVTKSSKGFLANYEKSFDQVKWNRRGQTLFAWNAEVNGHYWFLNLEREHLLPKNTDHENLQRRVAHRQVRVGERTLLIGVGSARSLMALPKESLGKNIFAIERDTNTVELISERGINPLTRSVNYIAADGRGFLEKSSGKWDWIIIESALDQSKNGLGHLFSPNNLYTKEALNLYLSRLSETGTLVIEVNRPLSTYRFRLSQAIINVLQESTWADKTRYLASADDVPWEDGLFLAVTRKGNAPLEIDEGPNSFVKEIFPVADRPNCLKSYADAVPFSKWMCMSPKWRSVFNWISIGILSFFVLVLAFVGGRSGLKNQGLRQAFLFQGIGQTFGFIAVNYYLRAMFVDEIFTFYVFTIASTLTHAAAAFTMSWLHAKKLRPAKTGLGIALAVSALTMFALLGLPAVFEGSLIIRGVLFLAAIVPFYFLSSLLFNETLQTAIERGLPLREAFMYDAIAVIPAYAVLPFLLFDLGIVAVAVAAGAAFAIGLLLVFVPVSAHTRRS